MDSSRRTENDYAGLVDAWKIKTIVLRAQRRHLIGIDLDNAVQYVVLESRNFKYDPLKANGASEELVFKWWVELKLSTFLRDDYRARAKTQRFRPGHVRSYELKIELQADVQYAVSTLPEFERKVCELLSRGFSKLEVCSQLQCSASRLRAALHAIRVRFYVLDVDEWLNEK